MLYFTERGSGPPLLLVHGLMITGEMFDPVVEQFATRHRVIVPDLRGHGRSRGLAPPYSARQLAADLARLLDDLAIGSTAVLGYSQGLVVAGSQDQAVPLHHATMLRQGIAGSRLVIIDGADHALIWDRPQELVRITEEFLHA